MPQTEQLISWIGNSLSDYILLPLLIVAALYFTLRTRGVQFRMLSEMCRLLVSKSDNNKNGISSFQAFMVSIASRVGTGNLAGVATAIVLGGPGAVFWMWMIALFGASSAFIESTLAQLFKVDDGNGHFRGGPAYYILHGIGSKAWAVTFAVLISVTFGLAYNSVQCNTITEAFNHSWQVPRIVTAIVISVLTLVIIWGGIKSIARFSQWVVPIMAVAYLLVAAVIVCMNIQHVPTVFMTIIENAFGINQAIGGTVGSAMAMGIRRGLFSNEAGEGSAPNVAATAHVSHPVKQGLVQALGVFTDTLLICSCTAFIILCSGVHIGATAEGISLTQRAVDSQFQFIPGFGSMFVSCAIFFFAFTSIVANYYYGETNVRFITRHRSAVYIYRIAVTAMVFIGGISSLGIVWSLADITMSLMAICNLVAIIWLGKYAVRCLNDYIAQRRQQRDPRYKASTNPEIAPKTPTW
jgi:AGCS family alanine or glycine:cation symporter